MMIRANPLKTTMLAGLTLVLVGCGSSPFDARSYDQPVRIPISRAAAQPSQQETSIAIFEDATELDVESLVAEVLKRNPSVGAMEHAWKAATARRPQVEALDDPLLMYSVAPGSLADDAVRDGHKVELSQKFPWPGKLALRGEIAQRQANAEHHGIQTVRDRLIQATRRAYYDYYYVHRAIEINDVNLELLREFQRIAETKYSAGTASKQDALQSEVERFHLEHQAIVLQRIKEVAAATINTLLHRRPGTVLPPPPASLTAGQGLPDSESLQEQAVNTRPELQALAQRLEGFRTARLLARKEYYPDITVMGTYNRMWDVTEHQWMIGAGINVPIQIERRRGTEREAMSEAQRVAFELASGVDDVRFQVAEAHAMVREAEHVIRLYVQQFIPAAQENLKAAQTGYEANENDFLTLLTAEKSLMLVQLAHQQALTDYHQRWADLERAVGSRISNSNGSVEPKGAHNHE